MSGDHKTLLKGSPSQYVKLNVGGTLFYTTIGTLTKSDNMLRTMFSGRMEVLTDAEGTFCETTESEAIDRYLCSTVIYFLQLMFPSISRVDTDW